MFILLLGSERLSQGLQLPASNGMPSQQPAKNQALKSTNQPQSDR
jgi:hypothetical protein